MQTPKWKLFAALWAYTLFCWVFPYMLHRGNGFDVTDAFSGYPWNFSPFYAVSLFGGAYFGRRWLACLWPVAAYLATNLAIWAITGRADWAFIPEVWANYVLFSLIPVFGFGLGHTTAPLIPALWRGFSASLMFFLASNFVCFLASYPQTFAGLIDCYYMALPFYGPTVASTMFFTLLLFNSIGVRMAEQVIVARDRF